MKVWSFEIILIGLRGFCGIPLLCVYLFICGLQAAWNLLQNIQDFKGEEKFVQIYSLKKSNQSLNLPEELQYVSKYETCLFAYCGLRLLTKLIVCSGDQCSPQVFENWVTHVPKGVQGGGRGWGGEKGLFASNRSKICWQYDNTLDDKFQWKSWKMTLRDPVSICIYWRTNS